MIKIVLTISVVFTVMLGNISSSYAAGNSSISALKSADKGYSLGVLKGNSSLTYQYLNAACQKKFTPTTWKIQIGIAGIFLKKFGLNTKTVRVSSVTVRNATKKSVEALTSLSGVPKFLESGSWQTWVVQHGQWKVASCTSIQESMSNGSDSSNPSGTSDDSGTTG